MTTATPGEVCIYCGQLMPRKHRLLCANCREPIGPHDSWHHDDWSRAVHWDCSQPTGWPKLKVNLQEEEGEHDRA